ncbi:hypothetical protein DPMN_093236 [Dreissena polymorpha]|uniref:Fibronectin type-III domain-containing protein n=2 Tax=Dreissena polymorpha TaxID=45954 RepID=A0A9D4L2Y7_DREPO|nr:hypothetical protein DPMN_093236 [Dreissena polymorpha]
MCHDVKLRNDRNMELTILPRIFVVWIVLFILHHRFARSMTLNQPENLTCISYNFRNLTCSFSLDRKGVADRKVNWTMEYQTKPFRDWTALPPWKCNLAAFTCAWDSVMERSNWTFNRATSHYLIRIKVETQNTSFWSRHWNVSTSAIVKPGRVRSLNATLENASLLLNWKVPIYLSRTDFDPLDFRIRLQDRHVWDNRTIYVRAVNNSSNPNNDFRYNVSMLLGNANYTVTVQVKPSQAPSDLYWSDPETETFNTNATAPTEAPTMADGGFVVNEVGQSCEKDFVNVTFYWKNPHVKYLRGKNDSYKINIENLKTITTSTSMTPFLTTCLNRLGDYFVNVRLVNDVGGESPRSSNVTWGPWKKVSRARVEVVIVQEASDGVILEWSPPSDLCNAISNVTYYWCKSHRESDDIRLANCETLNWKTNDTIDGLCNGSVHHWLNNTGDPSGMRNAVSGMRYAVSIATSNGTGGMVWDKYRYGNYNALPAQLNYQVSISTDAKTSMTVKISNHEFPQVNQGGKPSAFQVIYSEVTTPGSACPLEKTPANYTANYLKSEITIAQLKSGATYVVCVRGVNHVGSGLYGQPFVLQLPEESISSLLVGIVGAFIVGMFVLLMSCLLRKALPEIKNYVKRKTDITTSHLGWQTVCEQPENMVVSTDSTPSSDNGTVLTEIETDSNTTLVDDCSDESLLCQSCETSVQLVGDNTHSLNSKRCQPAYIGDYSMVACNDIPNHAITTYTHDNCARPSFEANIDSIWRDDENGNVEDRLEHPIYLPCIPRPRNFDSCSSAEEDVLEQQDEKSSLMIKLKASNNLNHSLTGTNVETAQDGACFCLNEDSTVCCYTSKGTPERDPEIAGSAIWNEQGPMKYEQHLCLKSTPSYTFEVAIDQGLSRNENCVAVL